MKFTEFGLHQEVLYGLQDMGFEDSTPIQEQAIPIILEGYDLIACAQTGTGKTAAFLIPLIDVLDGIEGSHIKAVILCPTRELAKQIDVACEGLCYHAGVSSIAVYGGNKGGDDFSRQKAAFQSGADIVIATPGRLLQHISLGYVDLSRVEFLILDEADRMLDMGFVGDIMRITSYMPEDRQSLLFSATMPPKIREFAKKILFKPKEITLQVSKPAEGITQQVYTTFDDQKLDLLKHIFKNEEVQNMIIFASRKTSVDRISKALSRLNYDVQAMHSDRDQFEREKIMNDFKNRQVKILVATDILSRGIDVEGLSHVVNYDVPPDPEDYVHRIGRTARADKTGVAITFVNQDDQHRFHRIEKLIERKIPLQHPPEEIGNGPEQGSRGGKGGRSGGKKWGKKKPHGKKGGGKPGGGERRNKGEGNKGGGGPRNERSGDKPKGNRNNHRSKPRSGGNKNRSQNQGDSPKPA